MNVIANGANTISNEYILLLVIAIAGVSFVIYWFTRYGGKNMAKATKYNKDGSINQQWLAEEITRREGKKIEVNIGQVKEVLRVSIEILKELYEEEPDKVQRLFA